MSRTHEKTRVQFFPALTALVISVAVTGLGAYGFAKATGADGSAVRSYGPQGIITVEAVEWIKN
jgi:hypothetical protein